MSVHVSVHVLLFPFAVLNLFNSCNAANLTAKIFKKTGMHSSRMRTARLLTVSRIQGGLHPGGSAFRGMVCNGGDWQTPKSAYRGWAYPLVMCPVIHAWKPTPPPPWTHKHL